MPGYLELHNELFYNQKGEYIESVGGYARIATLIIQFRKKSHTLLFDGGDTFHGIYPMVNSKSEALIPVLNKLGFNALFGHCDFGYGPKHLKELLSQLNYPMMGINVYNHDDDSLFLPPFITNEMDSLKPELSEFAITL